MNPQAVEMYLHAGQMYLLAHTAKIKVAICGRGWGKSTADGVQSVNCIRDLPRSRGFFLGLTYNQILTKFLPPILDIWGRFGLKEHLSEKEPGHYVVGVKPPTHWAQPYAKVKKYTNIISFYNGAYIEMLSMDRKDLNLGGSYDWGLADEVQGINKERFKKEYFIAIRGNNYRYKSIYHHSLLLTGTMPWLSTGQWLLDYEEQAKLDSDILFLKRPSYDNIKALGLEYFKKLKRELTPMMYGIEIENLKAQALSDGFYPEFRENVHTYTPIYLYDDAPISVMGLKSYTPVSADYDPNLPIDISFDFGGNITSLLIGQEKKGEFRLFNMMYELSNSLILDTDESAPRTLLPRVLKKFLDVYGNHRSGINIWGDHTGHSKSDKSESSYAVVERILRDARVPFTNRVERTTNPAHSKKYNVVNQLLARTNPAAPSISININTCGDLVLSIQMSPITDDFKKVKTSERDHSLSPAQQTHFSDAFDYLIYNKYKHFVNMEAGGGAFFSLGSRK